MTILILLLYNIIYNLLYFMLCYSILCNNDYKYTICIIISITTLTYINLLSESHSSSTTSRYDPHVT